MSSNVERNNKKILRNPKRFRKENTEPEGLVRSLFRFCTELKKISWRRFPECIQVKNLFRFRRIFLLFLSTFELIWRLFDICRTFLVGSGKILFFLECVLSLRSFYYYCRLIWIISNLYSNICIGCAR